MVAAHKGGIIMTPNTTTKGYNIGPQTHYHVVGRIELCLGIAWPKGEGLRHRTTLQSAK